MLHPFNILLLQEIDPAKVMENAEISIYDF